MIRLKTGTLIAGIITLTIFQLFSGCAGKEEDHDISYSGEVRSVSVFCLEMEEVRQIIDGFGNLSFRSKADITSAVDGIIRNLPVDEGDKARSGQPVAVLYNIQLEIRREQAQAALFSAEAAYELSETQYREGRLRIESSLISIEKSELNLKQKLLELEHQRGLLENERELFSIGGAAEEDLASMELSFSALETEIKVLEKDIMIKKIGFRDKDIIEYGFDVPSDDDRKLKLLLDLNSLTLKSELKAAEAKVKSAETELQSAEALIEETKLFSPMDGIVGARYMETGERIQADDKIFTIFDSSEVDLVFGVPEEIGVLLNPGQPVELSLDAVKDRVFSATIRRISPTIETGSGNITIKAGLDNNEGLFRPGMFSRFSLTYGPPRQLIRLPANSFVRLDGSRGLVFLVQGGRVYPRSVVVEAESGGMHELIEGLEEGDVIVIDPSPLLKEGDPVDVQ